MRRIVVAVCLFLFLAVGVAADTDCLQSVAGLTWTETNFFSGQDEMGIHCTAWSLNEARHLWATAAHCVIDEDNGGIADRDYQIRGVRALPIAAERDLDVAVLLSDAKAPQLKVAKVSPNVGDHVYAAGHPLGWSDPIYAEGILMGRESHDPFPHTFLLFSLNGAPGNSGSPILKGGRVVSVWQVGFAPFSALAGGPSTEALYDYLKPYLP